MPGVKLAPVVGDIVVVRIDSICAFCSVERFDSGGRTGKVVPYPEATQIIGAATQMPIDHNILVEYDLPWSDGRGGKVLKQAFRADELVIL